MLITVLALTSALAATTPQSDPFAPLRPLVGEWTNVEGGGEPGNVSAGELSFRLELSGRVLVRRSFTDFPAHDNQPALHHEDLMLIYVESQSMRALYLDNEGHSIRYAVSVVGPVVTFLSEEAASPAPRQRLTYRIEGPDTITLAFDLAAPGENFVNHVHARIARKK
jgi:hypothetical protein